MTSTGPMDDFVVQLRRAALLRSPATGRVLLFGGHYPPNATVFSDRTVWYDVGANRFTLLDPPPCARQAGLG